MKSKIWRSGNSWVITIPSEIVGKFNLIEKKLIDFDIKDVFEETEKIFDDMFGENMFLKENAFRKPILDLEESDNTLKAIFEIPGVDKKDIQLSIADNNIEVKVEKKSETKIADENKGIFRSERSYSGFYRSMNLPAKIIPDKCKASYKNGILEVIMPKARIENSNKKRLQIE